MPDRPRYMISVAADLVGMHPQTLRIYEQKGLIRPRRTAGGTRLYSEADVERLRSVGFSDEAIFDIIETAAMYNFTNRIASATGMLPNREYHGLSR